MQTIIDIYSNNAAFQLLEAAKHNRNKRHRQGYFIIEGVKAIDLALARGWPIEGALHARDKALSRWAEAILRQAPKVYRLPPELMARLSDKEETSELLVLGRTQQTPPAALCADNGLFLLLDRPASPGNLGSVIRSADAFGANGLLISGHSADLFDPQTVRASIGTLFTLPCACIEGPEALIAFRAQNPGIRLIGTSAKGEMPIDQVDLTAPTLLLMGNETSGLSRGYKALCDVLATIPIQGAASSLNLASAASICLYEAARQRNR
ncbi:MAG: RNA methyltransferase [Oscillospiraceae bacterium]|jgi:TrmH family RNA methyltransferase|nr:RNA methyltransferase [Oscillospiraceae bacterium]